MKLPLVQNFLTPIFKLTPESSSTFTLVQGTNLKTLSGLDRAMSPFVPNAPFLYPLKRWESLTVFWCFHGVEKGCIGNNGVNWNSKTIRLDMLWPWRFLKYLTMTKQIWLVISFFVFVNASGRGILVCKLQVGHVILLMRNLRY